MMDLYFFTTTNGYRARLALEETGQPYNLHLVQLPKRENLTDAFRKISVSHKIPTLIDPDGPGGRPITLIESGAIMKYLAEKTASPLYPTDARTRCVVDQWLFYAVGTLAMTQTQLGLFTLRFPEDVPPAKAHFLRETKDHYSVIDAYLEGRAFFADDYSLADMAHYPYIRNAEPLGIAIEEYPNIKRWYDAVSARPAVERAYAPVT